MEEINNKNKCRDTGSLETKQLVYRISFSCSIYLYLIKQHPVSVSYMSEEIMMNYKTIWADNGVSGILSNIWNLGPHYHMNYDLLALSGNQCFVFFLFLYVVPCAPGNWISSKLPILKKFCFRVNKRSFHKYGIYTFLQ